MSRKNVSEKILGVTKIVRRVPRTVRYFIKLRSVDKREILETQERLYRKHNLKRDKALIRLNKICLSNFGYEYSERKNIMFSEHLVLFSAISLSGKTIKKILEIGTYDGKSAKLLSELFPEAEITTIDLPASDPGFANSYNRSDVVAEFEKERNELLETAPNVKFLPMNSIGLTNWGEKEFDLIWVDGDHTYPIVAMDLINSARLGAKNCFVLVDDVRTEIYSNDRMHKGLASIQVLSSLKKAGLIEEFDLFHKRLHPKSNVDSYTKKHVGFFKVR